MTKDKKSDIKFCERHHYRFYKYSKNKIRTSKKII